jgi:hypothetical protein
MTYRAWICESCGRGQKFRDNVWDCPGCGKEGCDDCFWMYGHCNPCCVGKTEGELWAAANAQGWDLSPPEEPGRLALQPALIVGTEAAR